jgi:hypothetical protein
MKIQKLIGWLLFVAALMVIMGIVIGNPTFWSFIDILVILISSGSGFILVSGKKQIK